MVNEKSYYTRMVSITILSVLSFIYSGQVFGIRSQLPLV